VLIDRVARPPARASSPTASTPGMPWRNRLRFTSLASPPNSAIAVAARSGRALVASVCIVMEDPSHSYSYATHRGSEEPPRPWIRARAANARQWTDARHLRPGTGPVRHRLGCPRNAVVARDVGARIRG